MNKKIKTELTDKLFECILSMETIEECYQLFEDLCTVKELLDLAQRMDVAVLLQEGANYQTISQQVNVSTATISRVSKCLNYGSGGYRDALAKLKAQEGEK